MYKIFIVLLSMTTLCSCKTQSKTADTDNTMTSSNVIAAEMPTANALPAAIVYKTKSDLSNNVPVMMDRSKTRIVSYPAPSDISPSALPIKLYGGYLLDRRGIGENVAFTSYTYQQYSSLGSVPSIADLMSKIIDRNPLAELYRLPISLNQAIADTTAVNKIIKANFDGCTPIVAPIHSISLK